MRKFYYFVVLCLLTTFGYAQSYITEIGQTLYDLQTNATIGTRVLADEYGVSAVWTQGFNAPGFSDRGTGYNHWNPTAGAWGNIPTARIESFRTGWPSVVHTQDGTEWVFAHNGIGIQSLKRDLATDGPWQEMGYVPANAPEAILWNRACAGGTDGNTIHLLASTTYNGITIGGLDQQILYYRSQDAGATWDIVDVTFPGMVPPMWGFQGDTYAMAANGNTVAVAIFGDLQDSYVWISNDNGDSWTQYLLNDFPFDNYQIDSGMDITGDGVEDRITSTNTSGSVAVDPNGTVHVSFATMDFTDSPNVMDNNYSIFRASGEIKYWNSSMAGSPMDASDDFLITAGLAPDLIGEVNIFPEEIAAYGNAGLVNHPNVVMGDNGEIFILYDAVKDGTQQDGLYRRHLFMVKSTDGGMTWTSPSDLTQNLDGINWEYNFACAAPAVYDGKIHMTAQRDLNPGFTTNTSESNMNSIIYVAVDAATLTSIINGCTDPSACNYTPEATVDNGTCILTPTPEVCDGIDNDCSGIVDDGVMITWNQDYDADGFGSSANGIWVSCNPIPGYVMDNSDCNDNLITYEDMDGDGFGSVIPASCGSDNNLDCNDSDPSVIYDFYVLDADQDGFVDFNDYYAGCSADFGYILYIDGVTAADCNDSDPFVNGENAYVADFDADGYGDFNDYYWGCAANPGYFMYVDGVTEFDCDVYSMTYIDNDGDGFGGDLLVGCGGAYNSDDCNDFEYDVDNGNYYVLDADADGFGDFNNYYFGCYAEQGYIQYNGSALQEDCNDNDPTVAGVQYYVYDADADGFGNFSNFYAGCFAQTNYMLYEPGITVEDCDDDNLTYLDSDGDGFGSNVLAPCSGIYNASDCDDNSIVYQDLDGDGVGSVVVVACGGSILNSDCDDLDPFSATNAIPYYADYEGDGFGTPWDFTMSCFQIPGYVLNEDDCYPFEFTYGDLDGDGFGSDELVGCGVYNSDDCDDNDINNLDGNYFVFDLDVDGFGDFNNYYFGCTADPGYIMYNGSLLQEDCNDSDPSVGGVQIFVADFDGDGFGDFDNYYLGCSENPGFMLYVEGVTQYDCDIYSITYVDADGDGFGNQNGELAACSGIYNTDDCDDNLLLYWDGDQDGAGVPYLVACNGSTNFTDCDDFDPTSPTNASHYYADYEGDGFGVEWDNVFTCYPPAGYVLDNSDCYPYEITYADEDGDGYGSNALAPCGLLDNTDCNDMDFAINSAAIEICNEVDDNCNVEVDEFVQTEFFADFDSDGFGDINNNTYACELPAGYTLNSEDCDDNLQTYQDLDMDGHGSPIYAACGVLDSLDCDDANELINTSSLEICNGIDENCDGAIDEGVQTTFWMDMDMDGFGDAAMSTLSCTVPDGFVSNDSDCNDLNASISPIASEVCDLVDNNCSGAVDEGVETLFFADVDSDGFGDVNTGQLACSSPAGFVLDATDCNDAIATTYPGASEVCNEVDDNCNGDLDEGVQSTFFMDMDGDGFGDAMMSIMACAAPNGFVIDPTDCNDMDVMVNPMANEVCNDLDDNCNIEIDEFVLNTYYHDIDGDGFGNLTDAAFACTAPAGYVENGDDCDDAALTYQDLDGDGFGSILLDACGVYLDGDCNDSDETVNAGAIEVCNDVDDNCNVEIDEFVLNTYYHDIDGDGFGNLNDATFGCTVPAGYVVNGDDCDDAAVTYQDLDGDSYGSSVTEACGVYLTDDCDDADANQYPTAAEICDNADQNCDGQIDEGLNFVTYYNDADGDAYGTTVSVVACIDPGAGYTLVTGDCDDTDAAINPDAVEVADNTVDENCDGVIATEIINIESSALNIYPNPSNGVLNIELPQSMTFDWSVINMTGSVVEKGREINQSQLKWSNVQWENGLYQIIIEGENGQRFIAAWLLQK